jgi:hypothetical protein
MNFIFFLSLLFPSLQFERIDSSEYVRVSFVILNSRVFLDVPETLAHERVELNEHNVSLVLDRLVACLRVCASPGIAPLVRLFFGK